MLLHFLTNTSKDRFLWDENYKPDNHQPYATELLYKLLKNNSKDFTTAKKELKNVLDTKTKSKDNLYVYIGGRYFLTDKEVASLINFAESGNEVLICSESIPEAILEIINAECNSPKIKWLQKNNTTHNITIGANEEPYSFNFQVERDSLYAQRDWFYFYLNEDNSYYDVSYPDCGVPLIENESFLPVMMAFPIGEGRILIHLQPICLTNFYLVKPQGKKYVERVFSFTKNKKVIWDESSRYYKNESSKNFNRRKSPLSFIFTNKSLKTAWYLLIVMGLLFFIIKTKREQRVIPVIIRKKNTSLLFLDTLSGLFYKKSGHKKIVEMKMNHFRLFVKQKLMVTFDENSVDNMELIAQKANINVDLVKSVVYYYISIKIKDNVNSDQLIEFNNRLKKFYKAFES